MISLQEVNRNILLQFHNKIEQYKLKEGFKTSADFDVAKVVNPSSINKWSNQTAKKLFRAAKKYDSTALEYLFWKMKGAIYKVFWKNFLGPSGSHRRYRIQQENAWEDWLGIAWQAMTKGFADIYSTTYRDGKNAYTASEKDKVEHRAKGALEDFDFEEIPEDRLFNIFAGRYKLILSNAAGNANNSKRSGGLAGSEITSSSADYQVHQYEPTWTDGKDDNYNSDDAGTDRGYKDNTFEEVYYGAFKDVEDRMASETFMKKWISLSKDPWFWQPYSNRVKVIPAKIFEEIIGNPNAELRQIGTKFDLSRNTADDIRKKAVEKMMDEYEITGPELTQAFRDIGNKELASFFKKSRPKKKK